jgi:hypothetical protein
MTKKIEKQTRFNEGKPELSYIDLDSMMDCADVFTYGAAKYDRDNWKKGDYLTSLTDSLLRHLAGIQRGEFLDPESQLPHHAHMMCNVIFLSHNARNHPNFIDMIDPKEVAKYYKNRKHIPHKHE